MSRIRTIKPEFWASEQILSLSIEARLLFIGMWNFCDDSGIHPASLRTIKAVVYPGDEINVEPLTQELLQEGLIVTYSVNGKSYWRVTGWKHQKIDKPTFKHPWPCGSIPSSNFDYRSLSKTGDQTDSNIDGIDLFS